MEKIAYHEGNVITCGNGSSVVIEGAPPSLFEAMCKTGCDHKYYLDNIKGKLAK